MFANIKKKTNKQFRKKTTEDDDNTDKQPDQLQPTTTPTDTPTSEVKQTEEDDEFERKVKERADKKKKIETTRKPTKSSVLSFENEEEDNATEFRITSSTSVDNEVKSKKKSRPLRNEDAPTTAAVSALRNTSDYYTPENLEAMKKLQMNYNAPKKPKEPLPQDADNDEDLMETDSTIPTGVILNAEQADAFEDEEDEEIKRWEMEQIKKGNIQFQDNEDLIHDLEEHNKKILKQRDLNKRLSALPSGPRPSLDDLVKKLKLSLSDLEKKHEIHILQLNKSDQQIDNAKGQIEMYENQTKKVAEQYVWYQEMKNYVADLCECLAEKAPIVEECEEQMVKVEVERWERNASVVWFEKEETKTMPEYLEMRENVKKRADNVFVDVNEEYSSLSTIKQRFEEWKKKDLPSYRDAFVSLSMPQIFAPYVRLELLLWDPLVTATFENQQWYQELFNYGIIGNRMEENDEDNNLVPKLVEKVVAAKVSSFANNVWNPRTQAQNRAMLAALDQILIYVEPHSEAVKDILTAVQVTLINVVENMPLTIHDDALPDEIDRYLMLIKNTLAWEKFLPESVIFKIVLDQLINMRLSAWINRAKSKDLAMETAEKILNMVPKTWIAAGKNGKLGLLHSSLLGLLKKIGANDTSGLLTRMRAIMLEYNDRDIVQRIDARKI